MIYDIGHVAIATADMDKMKKFYENLGFRRSFALKNEKDQDWIVYMKLGGFFLELIGSDNNHLRSAGNGLAHVCLLVDDMYETVSELRAKGVKVSEPKMGLDGSIQSWTRDPEDNSIELMQVLPGSLQAKALAQKDYSK